VVECDLLLRCLEGQERRGFEAFPGKGVASVPIPGRAGFTGFARMPPSLLGGGMASGGLGAAAPIENLLADNDREARFAIANVLAMVQPAGTFFAWGLSDQGKWTRPRADLRAPVAACDVGFCTLNLFMVEGGEVVGRFTSGDTVGMRRAAELIINSVRNSYGVGLSLHEADALVRQKQPRLCTARGEQNLRSQVDQALDTTAAAVVSFVERHWGNGHQFAHLLFTGGGAEALQDSLLRQYPHGVVLPNAVTANALGLAPYAARVFPA
jgi:hypothetical protein